MDNKLIMDSVLKRMNDAELGLSSKGNLLDFFIDLKDLSKSIDKVLSDVKESVVDYVDTNYGENEFPYRDKLVKLVHKSGTVNYDNVPIVARLVGDANEAKAIYKNYLLSLERGNALIEDGHLVTDDGEMIPKEQLPVRNSGSSYVRVAQQYEDGTKES